MRVCVTGGRTFTDRTWLWAGLEYLHNIYPITEIIEGGQTGADVRAREWAKYRGIKCTTVEADWNKYDRAAGPIRNAQMADMRPDVVLAAPGKVGTANMIEAARTRGLNVVMLERMPVVRTYEKGATSGATPSP
jgi:hypothetical protein